MMVLFRNLVQDVSTKQKVGEFLQRLAALTDIPEDKMGLLRGFPPKKVPYDRAALLESLGLTHQDTLIVEFDVSENPGSKWVICKKMHFAGIWLW
jgi:hypothetical protein